MGEMKKPKRSMNWFHIGLIVYMCVAGGPYGIEAAIRYAGPLVTLVGTFVILIFWALPQIPMSFEISLMIPDTGDAMYKAVFRGLGPLVGFVNGYTSLMCALVNLALYVSLLTHYLVPRDWTMWPQFGVSAAILLVVDFVNIVGFRWVSRLSGAALAIMFSPFFALLGWLIYTGIISQACPPNVTDFSDDPFPNFTTSTTTSLPPTTAHQAPMPITCFDFKAIGYVPPFKDMNVAGFLGIAVWGFGGFDALGQMAGEIQGGLPVLRKGIILVLPFLFLTYILPLGIAVPARPDYRDWRASYFVELFHDATPWLGYWGLAAAAIGTFVNISNNLWPLAQTVRTACLSSGVYRQYPAFLGWSWQRKTGTIRPVVPILFVSLLVLWIQVLDFSLIAQGYMIYQSVNLWFEYAALVGLRIREPKTPRPYRVRGGLPVVVSLGLPTFAISILSMAYSDWKVLAVGGISLALFGGLYFVRRLFLRFFPEADELLTDPGPPEDLGGKAGEEATRPLLPPI